MKRFFLVVPILLSFIMSSCTDVKDVSFLDISTRYEMVQLAYVQKPQYNVSFNIDFCGNLIFNKYNVDVYIDGQKNTTLTHGIGKKLTLTLIEGNHTFSFISATDNSIKGVLDLNINSDMECEYKLYCFSDKISLDKVYVHNSKTVASDEAMMPSFSFDYIGKNYMDVKSSLHSCGFTNIKCEPVYDIVFGITTPKTVKSIYVGNQTSFSKGDVFKKDVNIVIYYHMPYSDDPSPKQVTTTNTTVNNTDTSISTSSTTIISEEQESKYDYAFVYTKEGRVAKSLRARKRIPGYSEYILLDLDTKTSRMFATGKENTAISVGTITGDVDSGFNISYDYDDGKWDEYLTIISTNEAELIDGDEHKKVFSLIEPSKAEKIMNEGHYRDKVSILNHASEPENKYPIIVFGSFEGVPLQWLVLESHEDRTLLVSRFVLGSIRFNHTNDPNGINWEKSTYRHWLNNTFYEETFSDEEQKYILTAAVEDYSSILVNKDYNITNDKVFILNHKQVDTYFPSTEECRASYNPMLLDIEDRKYSILGYHNWWILDGDSRGKGTIQYTGLYHKQKRLDDSSGARPAILIDTNYVKEHLETTE